MPELGESATRYLSTQQEQDIGKGFLQQLLNEPSYVSDPFLRHYLNSLGAGIGEHASLRGLPLHFNLIAENELNAFAVPGGYITFNTGLLLTTETESELASVVGHEIAHLSQRHLPRLIARQQSQKLPTTAAILASILLGGQAAVAGVTLAQANLLSNQLSYSREFEREADAIGMQLMASSGYDPKAMAGFFGKLQRFTLVTSKDVPEFLRTHPLSYTRVAEAEARQASLPEVDTASSFDFHLARARIRALYSGHPDDAVDILNQQLVELEPTADAEQRDAIHYGIALAQSRLRQYSTALEQINKLADSYPDNVAIAVARGEILGDSGDTAGAAEALNAVAGQHPDVTWITQPRADALLANGEAAEAKKVLRYQLRRDPGDFLLYPGLSDANVELGKLAEAHQADAEYLAAIGKYQEAVSALRLALRENDEQSDYLTQSIGARVTELERLRLNAEQRAEG